jgi:hypothetical protein
MKRYTSLLTPHTVQFILLVITLVLFVLGAGAPAALGGIGG